MVSTRDRLAEIGPIKRGEYSRAAKQFGVSRERVRQIVAPTPCPRCGGKKTQKAKVCHRCRWEQHRIMVACAECGAKWIMQRSAALASVHHFCKNCRGTLTEKHRYVRHLGYLGCCPKCGHRDQLLRFRLPKIRRDGGKPNE